MDQKLRLTIKNSTKNATFCSLKMCDLLIRSISLIILSFFLGKIVFNRQVIGSPQWLV